MEQIPDDLELRRSWNKLGLGMEHPDVFYTYEWAIAVQRAYQNSVAPLVLAGYEGESLIGLVALARKKTRAGEVVFLAADTADYCDFMSDPSKRREFVEAVLCHLQERKIAKITLANLPADSLTASVLAGAASRCRYHLHLRKAYLCARVVLGSIEERAVVKQSVRGKKRLRRNIRELTKRGPVHIKHDTNWEEVAPVLPPFIRAHVARFLQTARISNLIRDERRVFLDELAREMSATGWMVMSRLLVGDVTAAWNYGFRFGGSWFWYQPTVKNTYGEFSPGYCLLAKIVEETCDSPDIDIVDLGLGAEDYKERFATASRQTLYCELNRSIFGHLRTVARSRAAEVAKASPGIEDAIRRVISRVAGLRNRLRESGLGELSLWVARRIWNSLFAFESVLFFEWTAGNQNREGASHLLRQLDSDLLGAAGIIYGNDSGALSYLMRSAQRLESGEGQGFVLFADDGKPVHFCWVHDFEGFKMAELDRTLHAPAKDAVMIFDCFTPSSVRGHGFFAKAIAVLGDQLQSQGKAAWIFGAAGNHASLRGIEKTAFAYRFSLGRRRVLYVNATTGSIPSSTSKRDAWSVPAR